MSQPPETLDEQQVPEEVITESWSPTAEEPTDSEESRTSVGTRMSEFRERFTRALTGLDRGYPGQTGEPEAEPTPELMTPQGVLDETAPFDVLGEVPVPVGQPVGFPIAPLGYNRAAVDEYIAELEREIAELREAGSTPVAEQPPLSIAEELERLGEQTASILVVAHDKAHETTRLAQEQAERCVADAAENAVAITEEAQRRLQSLDLETDTVWHERMRLLEDARSVGAALVGMIDTAKARFPEELEAADAGSESRSSSVPAPVGAQSAED